MGNMNSYPIMGYRIVTSSFMTVPEERVVDRSWKERLFSLPWHPMRKTKTIIVQVPSQQIFIDHVHQTMYCHPSLYAKIAEEVSSVSNSV